MKKKSRAILYAVEGAVAIITLNRPEKRNALDESLISGLKDSLREADGNDAVGVVVITGAGNDFCSGADLASLQKTARNSVTENLQDAQSLMELFSLIRHVRVPVVAAVRGRALAGGCGLATACDLVLAARSARFGYPEVKIGFVPAMVMAILRRNVSEKRAFELITRGSEISAEQAMAFGLVNQVFADESFDADVRAYTHEFEKMSASAMGLTKTLLYKMDNLAFPEALETGADVNVIARLTDDCQEKIAKFLSRG